MEVFRENHFALFCCLWFISLFLCMYIPYVFAIVGLTSKKGFFWKNIFRGLFTPWKDIIYDEEIISGRSKFEERRNEWIKHVERNN